MVIRKLLDPVNPTKAEIFYITKLTEIIIFSKTKDFVFGAF